MRTINQVGKKEIILGVKTDKYLVYPDVSGMVSWYNKDSYEELKNIPDYILKDDEIENQKVVEIFKRKYDLDFYSGKLEWNESLTPQYHKYKRIKLALESIGMKNEFRANEMVYSDDFYFSMIVGKFETINEIIDSQLQELEEHSRFEWHKTVNQNNYGEELSNQEIEKGLIQLCKFLSSKIIVGKYNSFLFTDIYALWKTFLLGSDFIKYGEIKIIDNLESKFVCTFKKGDMNYHFNYQFFVC